MQLKKLSMICAWIAGATLAAAQPSFAADTGTSKTFPEPRKSETVSEFKPSVGLNLGIASPESDRRSATSWGVEYSVQPVIPFSSAVELSGFMSPAGGVNPTITRTQLMWKGAYNFGGTVPVIKDSYVGIKLGPVFDNVLNKFDAELGFAPMLGFDIPLGDSSYSLGANANYMFVGGPNNDAFALNAVAKYWF